MSTSTMMRGDKPLPSLEYIARLKIAAECCELAQRWVPTLPIYIYILPIYIRIYSLYTV